jgi:hypothetical protein
MRKNYWFAMAVLVLAACGPRVMPPDPITQMANRCAIAVSAQGLQQGAAARLSSRMVTDGELAAWGGIISPDVPVLNSRGLPVAEVPVLDNGYPGAAWQFCMGQSLRQAALAASP